MIDHALPPVFRGQEPLPVQGTSFAYTFDTPDEPTRKRVQYFETLGDRAIWADGWKAVARHTSGADYDSDVWELFHADQDFSETNNLATEHPQRLDALVELWRVEADRYGVLPLADNTLQLYQDAVPAPRATYVFYPAMTRLDRLSAPDIYNYGSRFAARVRLTDDRASGVIIASGDSSCGYELYLKDGYLCFGYVYTRNEIYAGRSSRRATAGDSQLTLAIAKTGDSSGIATLFIYEQVVDDAPD